MSSMRVDILEERWTSTTVQTTFTLDSLSKTSRLDGISIDLPLPDLGWTFALSLAPGKPHKKGKGKPTKRTQARNWIPAAFSFRQHGSGIRWGSTSIHAQLAHIVEQPRDEVAQPTSPQATVVQPVFSQATVDQPTSPQATAPQHAFPRPAFPQATVGQPVFPQTVVQPIFPQVTVAQPAFPQATVVQPTSPHFTVAQPAHPLTTVQPASPHFSVAQPGFLQATVVQPTFPHFTVAQPAHPLATVTQPAFSQATVVQPASPHVTVAQSAFPQATVAQCLALQATAPRCAYSCSSTSICAGECASHDMVSNLTPLAAMNIILADTPLLELPLTTSCMISSLRRNKLQLVVTISQCPLPNGLFGARLDPFDPVNPVNEAQGQAQLATRSGSLLLSRSLTTGKLFDVKFLTPSTRFTFGNTRESLPTYASLSVLGEHVDLLSSLLKQDWMSALTAPNTTSAKSTREISCPQGHEYDELDSDFEDEDEDEDEDEPSSPPPAHEESGTERSSSSLSSFELEGVSDQGLADHQPKEFVKDPKEQPSDSERTIWVKFAAYRTWHAFVWYCYTGNLEFCKLKSQGGRHFRAIPFKGGPPPCSPKSMYRLAHLLGDKDLEAKALAAIKERMTEENVLDETFSVFTSKYPDVRNVQLSVLMAHRGSPNVKEAFLRAMEKYSSMPHARPAISAFYDKLVE